METENETANGKLSPEETAHRAEVLAAVEKTAKLGVERFEAATVIKVEVELDAAFEKKFGEQFLQEELVDLILCANCNWIKKAENNE